MIQKRGVIISIAILSAITAASFSVWFIPQNQTTSFVITDFETQLESVKERHAIIVKEIDNDFQSMLSGTITPDNFIMRAKAANSEVNSLIVELVQSGATQEWHESYLNYIEALKHYNTYLRETLALANKIKEGSSENIQENLKSLDAIKKESESLVLKSVETKP